MEIETLKPNLDRVKNNNSSDSRLPGFDLASLIETMKQSYTWANGELNALVLFKSPGKNILLTAMHGGTEIVSFQTKDSATFQIIEGRLKVHIRKDSVTLNKDQLLTLDENIKYRLIAEGETVFLLTVSNTEIISSKN